MHTLDVTSFNFPLGYLGCICDEVFPSQTISGNDTTVSQIGTVGPNVVDTPTDVCDFGYDRQRPIAWVS